jgi:hypothetical protein
LRLPLNPPFNQEFETTYFTVNLPPTTTDEGLVVPSLSDPFAAAVIRLWDANFEPAIVEQWNLSVQHLIKEGTTFQVGYVGQHGTHLMVPMPYLQKQMHSDGTITPSPYLSGNPSLQSKIGQISGTASLGVMRYDALQAVLQRNSRNGLQYQITYTYSKCLTDSSGFFGSNGGEAKPTSAYWQNLYNPRAEWGPCYYDVTHILTSSATYDIPIGRDRRFGRHLNSVANTFLGNWQLDGILSLHGGFPLTISANDNSGTESRGPRADCIAPPHVFGRRPSFDPASGGARGIQWFDPGSYASPAAGTFGSCGVGTVRGPGLSDGDLGVQKEFSFADTKRIEFRAEFINLTNTPILNSPQTGIGTSLGLITSAQGQRTIEFALKFNF